MMEKRITIKEGGRVQLSLTKGFDEDYVKAALALSPILIRVDNVNNARRDCTLIFHYPKGITASELEPSQKGAAYWANSRDDFYSRLSVNRNINTALFIEGNEDSTVLKLDLIDTRTNPIIIDPYFGEKDGPIRFQLRIAARRSWLISKEEHRDIKLAEDPLHIPVALERLLDVSSYTLPSNEHELRFLSLRLKNTDALAHWYSRRCLSESTREKLTVYLGSLNDFMLQVQSKIEALTGNPTISGMSQERLLQMLTKEVGIEKSVKIMSMLNAQQAVPKPVTSFNSSTLESFIDGFANYPGFDLFKSQVLSGELPDVFVHKCKKCSSTVNMMQKPVATTDGSKLLWLANCSGCGQQSQRTDWGDINQVAMAWNKINGGDYQTTFPEALGFSNMDQPSVRKCIKDINKITSDIRQTIKDLPPSERRVIDEFGLHERLLKISAWGTYVKSSLAQQVKSKE